MSRSGCEEHPLLGAGLQRVLGGVNSPVHLVDDVDLAPVLDLDLDTRRAAAVLRGSMTGRAGRAPAVGVNLYIFTRDSTIKKQARGPPSS